MSSSDGSEGGCTSDGNGVDNERELHVQNFMTSLMKV